MAESRVKLVIDSQEFDAKLKRAGDALNRFFDVAKKGDRTFEVVDEGVTEAVQAMGKMETASKSAKGSLSELQKAFTDMSLTYRRFTDEEKQSPVGKAMAQSLAELKTRIQDTKKDLAAINQELSGSKFGQFGGVIDTIGHKMGLTANATELLTSKTALMYAGIGAGIAIVGKATDAWVKYNQELAKQDQITTVTTGLKGTESNHMTDMMRALSDTYKVDFREAINAANVLMTQFGKTGDEAISLIKDGMQGMIMGDGPKMLKMIQQFAPAFRDAGISADKLIAIIHNSEGGLFSEQNMSAILMGIKNIRLMTKQTSEDLAKLGIDGQEMSRKMSDGSMTVFEALKKVAEAIEGASAGSQEAGRVMQDVFGRQGAMQGMKLGRAIAELNTNLEETKRQTGEVGDAFADLQTANEHLNTAIREAFSYDGWEQMAIGIKSTLIDTLADVIDQLGTIKGLLAGLTPGQAKQERYGTTGTPDEVKRDLEALSKADADTREAMYQGMLQKYEKRFAEVTNKMQSAQRYFDHYNNMGWVGEGFPVLNKGMNMWYASTKVNTARSNVAAEQDVLSTFRKEAAKILNPQPVQTTKITTNQQNTTHTPKTQSVEKELSIQQKIAALEKEAVNASDERLEEIKKTIAALDQQLAIEKEIRDVVHGREPQLNQPVGDRKAFETEQAKRYEAEMGKPTLLESMQYNTMKEINAENVNIDTKTLHSIIKNSLQSGIETTSLNLEPLSEQIANGINVPDKTWQSIIDQYNELRKQIGEDPIKINLTTGEAKGGVKTGGDETVAKHLGQMAGGMSSIMSSLEQLGIQLPEGFKQVVGGIQAVTSILTTISAIVSAIEAFSAAGSIPFFASGGIVHAANGWAGTVPGNRYSGDQIPIMANSGEVVLTRAMAGNLASQLQGSGERQTIGTPYVSGEQIYLGLNNYLRRSGMGEILTARR